MEDVRAPCWTHRGVATTAGCLPRRSRGTAPSDAAQPFALDRVYVNFIGDEGAERTACAYGEKRYQRLVGLKDEYDPTNLFRLNQNITPTAG